MTEITRSPPTLSGTIAVLAGAVSLLGSAVGALAAGVSGTMQAGVLAAGGLGVVLVASGAFRGVRRHATYGGAALFLAVALPGVTAPAPVSAPPLLLGFVGAVLAWDVAEHGIGVGEQLGGETDTGRLVAVHAATTLVVGTLGAGLGYGIYVAAAGGQPISALVLLLVGALALVAAVRR